MTDLVPASRIRNVEYVRLPNNRATLAGTLSEVNQLLEGLRRAGQLVSASTPVRDGRPGIYAVNIRLLPPPAPAVVATPRRRGVRFWAVVVAVGLLALAGVLWAVVAIVEALVGAITGLAAVVLPSIVGVIVVLGAAVVIKSAGGGGGGFSGTFKGNMD